MAHSAESESDREEDSTEAPLDGAQEEVFFPWGDRLPERRGKSGMRFFKSFERQGETYKLGDVCFLDSGDNAVPNYIGKLVELWDEGPGTQQTCQVRWFFRPNKDIDADARGLRDWRQSLNELPKNKRAQKKKEVFISFNERPNDTENIEDHNSLQCIMSKVNILCTAIHPNCRRPSQDELAECDHWFHWSYCASQFRLIGSVTPVLKGLSAERLFNDQYVAGPPPQPAATPGHPVQGVLQPANYKPSDKAKKDAADSDSEPRPPKPLAGDAPRASKMAAVGGPTKAKDGGRTTGLSSKTSTGKSNTADLEGKGFEKKLKLKKVGSGGTAAGSLERPVQAKSKAALGQGGPKLGKLADSAGGGKPEAKDFRHIYEKHLNARKVLGEAKKRSGDEGLQDRKSGAGLGGAGKAASAPLMKKSGTISGNVLPREGDRSILGKRPAEEQAGGYKGGANGGAKGLASAPGAGGGSTDRPMKLQKVADGERPSKFQQMVGDAERAAKIQKGGAGEKVKRVQKDSEGLGKVQRASEAGGKLPGPGRGAKGAIQGGMSGLKAKLGLLKKPGTGEGGAKKEKRAAPRLTEREHKAELLRSLEAPAPKGGDRKEGGKRVLESASESESESETSSSSESESERPKKAAEAGLARQGAEGAKNSSAEGGKGQKVLTKQPSDIGKQKVLTKQPSDIGKQKVLTKQPSDIGKQKVMIKQPSDMGSQRLLTKQPSDVGKPKVGDSSSGKAILAKKGLLTKVDSFKERGASGPGLGRQDSGARPKKVEGQKQNSLKRPEVKKVEIPKPEDDFLGGILSGMTSTFKPKATLYEENDEAYRATKIKWADPLVTYFQESPLRTAEVGGSSGYVRHLGGADFLAKRRQEQHAEKVKREEAQRAREELRRLEEEGDEPEDNAPGGGAGQAGGAAALEDDWEPAPITMEEEEDSKQEVLRDTKQEGVQASKQESKREGEGQPDGPELKKLRKSWWESLGEQNRAEGEAGGGSLLPAVKEGESVFNLEVPASSTARGLLGRETSNSAPERGPASTGSPRLFSPLRPQTVSGGGSEPVALSERSLGRGESTEQKQSPSPLGGVQPELPLAPPPAPPLKVPDATPPLAQPAPPRPPEKVAEARVGFNKDSFDSEMRARLKAGKEDSKDSEALAAASKLWAKRKKERDELASKAEQMAGTSIYPALRNSTILSQKADAEKWRRALIRNLEQRRVLQFDNLATNISAGQLQRSLAPHFEGLESIHVLPALKAGPQVAGSAIAVFDSQGSTHAAARKLKTRLYCLGDPPRPLVGRRIQASDAKIKFAGPISIGRPNQSNRYDDRVNAVAVAHASQPNTIEFEFGAEWRLLQRRCAYAEEMLASIHAGQIAQLQQEYEAALQKEKPDISQGFALPTT